MNNFLRPCNLLRLALVKRENLRTWIFLEETEICKAARFPKQQLQVFSQLCQTTKRS